MVDAISEIFKKFTDEDNEIHTCLSLRKKHRQKK
mgnify:CR=1 FL=1